RTSVWERSGRGTATACLTCTDPTTLSEEPLITGNFENPVSCESSMTALTGSVASTQAICTRGVMISPAVRGPNATERCTRWDVSEIKGPRLRGRTTTARHTTRDGP